MKKDTQLKNIEPDEEEKVPLKAEPIISKIQPKPILITTVNPKPIIRLENDQKLVK